MTEKQRTFNVYFGGDRLLVVLGDWPSTPTVRTATGTAFDRSRCAISETGYGPMVTSNVERDAASSMSGWMFRYDADPGTTLPDQLDLVVEVAGEPDQPVTVRRRQAAPDPALDEAVEDLRARLTRPAPPAPPGTEVVQ